MVDGILRNSQQIDVCLNDMEISLHSMGDDGPDKHERQRSRIWIQLRDLESSNEQLVEKSFDLMYQEVIHTEAKDNIDNY